MKFRYPSFDEMRALEFTARRARAREMRRLIVLASSGLWKTLTQVKAAASTQIRNPGHRPESCG